MRRKYHCSLVSRSQRRRYREKKTLSQKHRKFRNCANLDERIDGLWANYRQLGSFISARVRPWRPSRLGETYLRRLQPL